MESWEGGVIYHPLDVIHPTLATASTSPPSPLPIQPQWLTNDYTNLYEFPYPPAVENFDFFSRFSLTPVVEATNTQDFDNSAERWNLIQQPGPWPVRQPKS